MKVFLNSLDLYICMWNNFRMWKINFSVSFSYFEFHNQRPTEIWSIRFSRYKIDKKLTLKWQKMVKRRKLYGIARFSSSPLSFTVYCRECGYHSTRLHLIHIQIHFIPKWFALFNPDIFCLNIKMPKVECKNVARRK